MNIRDFQKLSVRTMNKELTKEQQISNMVFGANGEFGEVTDILKKYLQNTKLTKKYKMYSKKYKIDKKIIESIVRDTKFVNKKCIMDMAVID